MERFSYRVKSQDLSAAPLTLSATVQEGFEIFDIGIVGGAAGLVARLFINSELMGGFPADAGAEHVIPVPGVDDSIYPLISALRLRFPQVPTFKISAGETFTLDAALAAGTGYMFYRELTEGDIPKSNAPGGSAGKERLFVTHGKILQSITALSTEVNSVTESFNPIGVSTWPFVGQVPVGQEMHVLGMATRLGAASGADITYGGFRIWKQQSAILSPDQGIVNPLLFQYPNDLTIQPPALFNKPIIFRPNEDMRIEAQVTNAAVGAQNAEVFFTFYVLQKFIG